MEINKEILGIVDEYLKSITEPESGLCWTSHDDAQYVYWANTNDREGAISYRVNAHDLAHKDLIEIRGDQIFLNGPEAVHLPMTFDFKKIRRRVEDSLRKNGDTDKLLRIAAILDTKLT
jgi:hypothetical protein